MFTDINALKQFSLPQGARYVYSTAPGAAGVAGFLAAFVLYDATVNNGIQTLIAGPINVYDPYEANYFSSIPTVPPLAGIPLVPPALPTTSPVEVPQIVPVEGMRAGGPVFEHFEGIDIYDGPMEYYVQIDTYNPNFQLAPELAEFGQQTDGTNPVLELDEVTRSLANTPMDLGQGFREFLIEKGIAAAEIDTYLTGKSRGGDDVFTAYVDEYTNGLWWQNEKGRISDPDFISRANDSVYVHDGIQHGAQLLQHLEKNLGEVVTNAGDTLTAEQRAELQTYVQGVLDHARRLDELAVRYTGGARVDDSGITREQSFENRAELNATIRQLQSDIFYEWTQLLYKTRIYQEN